MPTDEERARAWLKALASHGDPTERQALLHVGPVHVRRLLRSLASLYVELRRLWRVDAPPPIERQWYDELTDEIDVDPTPDLIPPDDTT